MVVPFVIEPPPEYETEVGTSPTLSEVNTATGEIHVTSDFSNSS